MTDKALRILELFCGIGGVSMAVRELDATVVAAVDINQLAVDNLQLNVDHPVFVKEIDSLPDDWFEQWEADLWWASPPCQPYTRRGNQLDAEDARAQPVRHLIERISRLRPGMFAMENVPEFKHSRAADKLRKTLDESGYEWREILLCPTELGIPNRRKRYYLVASQSPLRPWPAPSRVNERQTLASFLCSGKQTEQSNQALVVDDAVLQKYASAINIVDPTADNAVANCFTSAYGRSHVRSGSLLRTATGVRRFAPDEILQLLGFPGDYRFAPSQPIINRWRLVGNSLSVQAVRHILTAFDGLE